MWRIKAMDSMLLRDKVAIVAGGGRGNGAMTSKLLGEAGAAVAVVDIEPERAESTAAEIVAGGGRALPIVAELRETDQVEALVRKTRETFGGIDILVNVAGGMNVYAPWRKLVDWTEEDWDMIQARNL